MVILNNLSKNKSGFTLVELMVVITCLAIISGPIFLLIKSGSDSSLKGMMRIDTTLKARIVLHQIYADLKMACFPLETTISSENVLKVTGEYPNVTYKFQCFPSHQKYKEIFEKDSDDIILRNTSEIIYEIKDNEKDPSLPIKCLWRTENYNGIQGKAKLLSDRINYFKIKKIEFPQVQNPNHKQYYYLITLQLIDVLHSKDLDGLTGEKLQSNKKDIILADFFDVVYPEYFNALWNDRCRNPNWNTKMKDDTIFDVN